MTPKHPQKRFARYALINGESPWASKMAACCPVPFVTYGIQGDYALRATQIEMSSKGSSFKVHYEGQQAVCHTPLVGRFNILNTLAAIGAVVPQGFPLSEVCEKMRSFKGVRGRLEPVPNSLGISILVDYAHTDDALRCVLTALREFKKGKIITVFGCGGNRDQTKRPLMAKVVEELSDFAIVTVDNARNEDPLQICRDVMTGFTSLEKFMVELDRSLAIEKAITMARPQDIVLIAGKGHETKQIFADRTLEFDDHKIAEQICQRLA
jgi:UDP-N-acetylmuramoyl-L-alanyl-D-glutamate--2,6-diaminopimelate ligase